MFRASDAHLQEDTVVSINPPEDEHLRLETCRGD